jgi:serine/threonine-protein kinase
LGPVYRAYQPEVDRLVAVKVFRLDIPSERVHRLVAELEALLAADLTHPAVAAPLAAGITGNSAYLAQDFVAAESLDVVIKEYGPAPPADAMRVAAQLGGALDFAAAVNVLHGALHPRDVLVSPDDTRLTGLGITQGLERLGLPGPVRQPYTAPERVAGAAWDRRADIFSLAALVFELLCGKRITGAGPAAVDGITDVAGADPVALRRVFVRALAVEPSERFDTALAFADALKSAFIQPANDRSSTTVLPVAAAAGAPLARESVHADGDTRLLPNDLRLPTDDEPQRRGQDLLPPNGRLDERTATPDLTGSLDRTFETSRQSVDGEAEPTEVLAIGEGGFNDLELRAAERARYEQVESAPSLESAKGPVALDGEAIPDVARRSDIGRVLADAAEEPESPKATPLPPLEPAVAFSERALEQTRSAVWPLVLALLLGMVIGGAAAFVLLNRDRPLDAGRDARATTDAGATPAAAPSREFTESAVPPAPGPEAAPEPRGGSTVGGSAGAAGPTATPAAEGRGSSSGVDTPNAEAATGRGRAAPSNPRAAAPRARGPDQNGRAAPARPGRILVRSTPAGARVFINGRDAGVTPVTLRDLPQGTHTVRVMRDGYLPSEQRVSVSTARPAQSVTVELLTPRASESTAPTPSTPATVGRYTGVLVIESRPPGATVYLDGRVVGTTPLQLTGVDAGSHAIRLEREGYRRWTSSVRVIAEDRNTVTASLER